MKKIISILILLFVTTACITSGNEVRHVETPTQQYVDPYCDDTNQIEEYRDCLQRDNTKPFLSEHQRRSIEIYVQIYEENCE